MRLFEVGGESQKSEIHVKALLFWNLNFTSILYTGISFSFGGGGSPIMKGLQKEK